MYSVNHGKRTIIWGAGFLISKTLCPIQKEWYFLPSSRTYSGWRCLFSHV